MAQRRSIAWKELRVGILVLICFGLLAVAIVSIGGELGFGKKISYVIHFPDAKGLRDGAEVWLEGVMVGNVASVDLTKMPTENHRVDVVIRIGAEYDNIIRSDSQVLIRRIGLLGDNNVEITRGTDKGQPVPEGGFIQGGGGGDIESVIQGVDDAVFNFKLISDKIISISDAIDRGEGTLGKLLKRSDIHDNMNEVVLELHRLTSDIRTGTGTAGKLINDDALYEDLRSSIARMDGIMDKIDRGDGTIGKFMNDPALYNKSTALVDKFETIADRMSRGEGTMGKFLTDDQLYTDMRTAIANLNNLVAAVQNGEGTAGKLIKDPALYNSLDQATSEIQKLIYDLRQNPKKYLTINFRLF